MVGGLARGDDVDLDAGPAHRLHGGERAGEEPVPHRVLVPLRDVEHRGQAVVAAAERGEPEHVGAVLGPAALAAGHGSHRVEQRIEGVVDVERDLHRRRPYVAGPTRPVGAAAASGA